MSSFDYYPIMFAGRKGGSEEGREGKREEERNPLIFQGLIEKTFAPEASHQGGSISLP